MHTLVHLNNGALVWWQYGTDPIWWLSTHECIKSWPRFDHIRLGFLYNWQERADQLEDVVVEGLDSFFFKHFFFFRGEEKKCPEFSDIFPEWRARYVQTPLSESIRYKGRHNQIAVEKKEISGVEKTVGHDRAALQKRIENIKNCHKTHVFLRPTRHRCDFGEDNYFSYNFPFEIEEGIFQPSILYVCRL